MQKIKVTLSANAGVCIDLAGKRVWVDALHNGKVRGFSTLNPQLQQWVLSDPSFAGPDLMVYTHCHGDHYSRELTRQAMEKWPGAKVILPRQDFPKQILLWQEKHMLEFEDLNLEFLRLPHEGAQYADVPHYGLLLETLGKTVLLPGDCALADSALKDAIAGRKIDIAILDFPWITLRKGQRFIEEVIRPKHILVYHLPFEEDDISGYRQSAEGAAKQLSGFDIRLLQAPMQSEEINI